MRETGPHRNPESGMSKSGVFGKAMRAQTAVTARLAFPVQAPISRWVAFPSSIGAPAVQRPERVAKVGHGPANASTPTQNSQWRVR